MNRTPPKLRTHLRHQAEQELNWPLMVDRLSKLHHENEELTSQNAKLQARLDDMIAAQAAVQARALALNLEGPFTVGQHGHIEGSTVSAGFDDLLYERGEDLVAGVTPDPELAGLLTDLLNFAAPTGALTCATT